MNLYFNKAVEFSQELVYHCVLNVFRMTCESWRFLVGSFKFLSNALGDIIEGHIQGYADICH